MAHRPGRRRRGSGALSLSTDPCKTAILISGSGTNLQSFIDHVAMGRVSLELTVVFSNQSNAHGLQRAKNAGIATSCIQHDGYDDRESFDRDVAAALDEHEPELIILAGFMRILSPWFVAHYQGRVLNIHPALLPKYVGLDTHQRVLDAGESWHGSSVHFVTENLDGGPVILQGKLAVNASETASELRARVQALEHQIYPQAADWFAQGRLEYRDGAAWLDGKRLDEPVIRDFK